MHGFTYCGVRIGFFNVSDTYIHHNDIVDIPAPTFGYAVTIYQGDPMIEYNYFDATRHTIAGFGGYLKSEYTARHNLCGPRTKLHVFDMHGWLWFDDFDSKCELGDFLSQYVDNWVAGSMTIENNVVLASQSMAPDSEFPQEAVVVRGIPFKEVQIRNNWFFSPSPVFSDYKHEARLGESIALAGNRGDAVNQWYVPYFCNVKFSNNICGGLHPTNDIGLEAQWQPDAGRSGGEPARPSSVSEGKGPEKDNGPPEHVDPIKNAHKKKKKDE
jgi:hypothetical protein